MPLDPDLLALMPHSVTIAHKTGQDQYGAPTWGAGTAWQARVEGKVTLVRDAQGLQAVSRSQVYLSGVAGTGIRDKVTLPNGTSPPILSVATVPDETGDSFEVIYLE